MSIGKIRKEIIQKYVILTKEYFDLLNKSNVMTEMNHPAHCIFIGIHSFHRVFEHMLIKTKNLRKAYFYAQKSQYYYLEYIEQLYKSNISLNINYVDIILFIYRKTIFREDDGEDQQVIDFIEEEIMQISDMEGKDLFQKMVKVLNILFFWDNVKLGFETRIKICDTYLLFFLLNSENIEFTFVEIIQEKLKPCETKYMEILKEVTELFSAKGQTKGHAKGHAKRRTTTDIEKQEHLLLKIYVDGNTFLEKFEKGNMAEFVKWVYT